MVKRMKILIGVCLLISLAGRLYADEYKLQPSSSLINASGRRYRKISEVLKTDNIKKQDASSTEGREPDWSQVIVRDGKYYWPDASRGQAEDGKMYAQVLTELTKQEVRDYRKSQDKSGEPDWSQVIVSNGQFYWPDASRGKAEDGKMYAQVLTELTDQEINEYLKGIDPSEAAMLISKLDTELAAKVLAMLAPEVAARILLATVDEISDTEGFISRKTIISSQKAADILSAMDSDKAAAILAKFTYPGDVVINGQMLPEDHAANILSIMDPEKAAAILASDAISSDFAAGLLEAMDTRRAAAIIASSDLSAEKAASILSNMDPQKAAELFLQYTTQGSEYGAFSFVPVISQQRAADILSSMDPQKAAEILSAFLAKPGVFTSHLPGTPTPKERAASILGAMNAGDAAKVVGKLRVSTAAMFIASRGITAEKAANILSELNKDDSSRTEKILKSVTKIDADKADSIRKAMGTIADWNSIPALVDAFDFNGDGVFDFDDIVELFEAYTEGDIDLDTMDLDGDGEVDFSDAILLYQLTRFENYDTDRQIALLNKLSPRYGAVVIAALCEQGKSEQAGELLAGLSPEKGAEILACDEVSVENAAEILESMDEDAQDEILNALDEVDGQKADDIRDILQLEPGNWWQGMSVQEMIDYLSDLSLQEKVEAVLSLYNEDKVAAGKLFQKLDSRTAATILAADEVSVEVAADIISRLSADKAAKIFNEGYYGGLIRPGDEPSDPRLAGVISDAKAAAILESLSPAKAAAIIASNNLSASAAAGILEEMDAAAAAAIFAQALNYITLEKSAIEIWPPIYRRGQFVISDSKAAKIFKAMDVEKAAAIIDQDAMTVTRAANILRQLGMNQTTFDILSNVDSAKAWKILKEIFSVKRRIYYRELSRDAEI